MKNYRYFDLLLGSFVAVLIVSNVASSAKIVDWGFSISGIRLAFDAGTLLFPLSYIFNDVLTEVYGYKQSRRVIWIGFFWAVVTALYFKLIGALPGEEAWQGYAGDNAYNAILGGIGTGGLIVASLTAYLIGEFSNSFVLAKMKIATAGKYLWARTIGSTLIGQLLDTVIFTVIACAFGVFPWEIAMSIILANYIFKVAIEILFTPVTYRVVGFLKKAEGEDFYDRGTRFNPFRN